MIWANGKLHAQERSMTVTHYLHRDTSQFWHCSLSWRGEREIGTLSTNDGDGNGDVCTERKDWGENAVVVRILNIKHLPNLQR